MISDEPDEDADELDDETMLETFLAPAAGPSADDVADVPDWPGAGSRTQGIGFNLDSATVAWFRANYADWQQEIGAVLRGWIATRTDTQHLG